MKIVQVTPCYPPYPGGAEMRAKELSEKLAKKNHDIEVWTSNLKSKVKDKKINNLRIFRLRSFEFAHSAIIPSLFFKLLRVTSDSIIHVHVGRVFVPEVVYLVCKIRKIPYIAHIRADPPPSGRLGWLLPIYKKIFLKRVLRNADIIIALNKDYKNLFAKKYGLNKKKIIVIPNATDFRIISKEEIKMNVVKKLLFVGRFTNEKNVDVIIKALSILKNKDLKLFLAGDGDDKQKLINLIKEKQLEEQVIFLGRLNKKELYEVYMKSDLVLLPSKVECFSSVILESMSTGTPLIASDIPGTRSVIKNNYNGILVKATPQKIAIAINKIVCDKKFRLMLIKNGLKEIKKYSWEKIIKQTEKVYKEVLREHNKNQLLKNDNKK